MKNGAISRRHFIRSSSAGVAGILCSPSMKTALCGYQAERTLVHRTLGKTDMRVPVIGMGILSAGTPALIQAALDAGDGLEGDFGAVVAEPAHSHEVNSQRVEAAFVHQRAGHNAVVHEVADHEPGFGADVELAADDAQAEAPAESGVLIANPPYGVRIGEQEELAALYPKIGETLKKRFAGWNCYFLTSDLRLPKLMRLAPSKKTPLFNGPLECRLFEIKMVAGSNRKDAK